MKRTFLSSAILASAIVVTQATPANAEISYADAGSQFQSTNLTSATMATETFDSQNLGDYSTTQTLTTSFGRFERTGNAAGTFLNISNFNQYGGAGGAGKYMAAVNTTLTLNSTQRYIGFWWSAGNTPNNVTLNLVGGGTETFNAGNLSAALGSCAQGSAYCHNPNTNVSGWQTSELYAYVHIRNETGFNSVVFSGTGFELDNVSVSQTIPDRVSTESTFSSQTPRTDCSSVNSADATSNTRACPRTITISTGTASQYNPLLESQITGYSYPGTVSVTNADVSSGVGAESRSGNVISLSSNTVGTFTVNFSISNSATGGSDTSRITVVVETVTANIPAILYIDPKQSSKKLPIPAFTGATSVTMCTSQVNDSTGNALSGSAAVELNHTSNISNGVTRGSTSNLVTYTGSQANINNQLANLNVVGLSNAVIVNGNSKFLRIIVTPTSSSVSNFCQTGVSRIIELAPLGLSKKRNVAISFS